MLKLGIVGQPLVTITVFVSEKDQTSKNPTKARMDRLKRECPETRLYPLPQ